MEIMTGVEPGFCFSVFSPIVQNDTFLRVFGNVNRINEISGHYADDKTEKSPKDNMTPGVKRHWISSRKTSDR